MSKLKTVNIKGKPYTIVNERIMHFRSAEEYKGWALDTEIIELNEKYCVLKGLVLDPEGVIKASGMAREVNGDTFINKTSFLENCETSAWGRALGNMGIGIDGSVASYEEVANAVNNQPKKTTTADLTDMKKRMDKSKFANSIDKYLKKFSEEYILSKEDIRLLTLHFNTNKGK